MKKVYCIGKGLVTPVGSTVPEVLSAVREGRSAMKLYPAVPEPYRASLLSREGFNGSSFFEHIAVQAARNALSGIEITPRTALVLSTIKGNVEMIGRQDISLGASARRIADALGIQMTPLVVSNACISGLAALVQGMRIIRSGEADKVVVVGAEVQSRFIITGFQSLKALSEDPCKPFDRDRKGLNLGEAAAAMVLSKMPDQVGHDGGVMDRHDEGVMDRHDGGVMDRHDGGVMDRHDEDVLVGHDVPAVMAGSDRPSVYELVSGCIRNDANHISGPSRTGEGSYKALRYVLEDLSKEDLAFVNVHGTATVYNDEMESIALDRAGLSDVPVNALKGVFGHTMGAAGILETIVSMAALDQGIVLPTKGFENLGVSRPVNVSAQERKAKGNSFVKLLSGFGGINGALVIRKGGEL